MNQTIISEKNFEKARSEIRKNKKAGKKVIFSSGDDELNRKILEKEKISILLISLKGRRDFQKQRNSGFNHVLAKLAKKSNVTMGIILDEIIDSREKEKAEILSRIRQNVELCSKNKLKMAFVSLDKKNARNEYDLKALGIVLGMPTWMIRDL